MDSLQNVHSDCSSAKPPSLRSDDCPTERVERSPSQPQDVESYPQWKVLLASHTTGTVGPTSKLVLVVRRGPPHPTLGNDDCEYILCASVPHLEGRARGHRELNQRDTPRHGRRRAFVRPDAVSEVGNRKSGYRPRRGIGASMSVSFGRCTPSVTSQEHND